MTSYLASLSKPIAPNCDASHYYLLNNYNPGYNADGSLAVNDSNAYASFTIPPTSVRHIGDALMAKNVSFKYYGDGWNLYLSDPNYDNPLDAYCNICNPFQYASDIMTNGTLRAEHIQDLSNFYEDVKADELPAVSIIKPSGFVDGHPASSKLDLFEGFVKQVVTAVQASDDCGKARPFSLPSTKAAAILIRATSNRWISSATAPVFPSLSFRLTLRAATSTTATRTTFRLLSSSSATGTSARSRPAAVTMTPTRSRARTILMCR